MIQKGDKVLIVGAGLSGICVATQLIKKDISVTLMDNGVNHSSAIAAGMITPLVFRRMTKSWRVDAFISYNNSFYDTLEKTTGASFHHAIQIRRMFSNEHEREMWLDRQERADFQDYMYKVTPEDDAFDKAINKYGSGRLKNASYIDTEAFLTATKSWIAHKGVLLTEAFDYSALHETTYKDTIYDHIIFCEGYLGVNNPWFGQLPLDQTKGETLTITSMGIPEDESINRKCFVLPKGDHTFKIGSTYVWNTPDTSITEEGRETLLHNLTYLTDAAVEVIDQQAGVRPTTKDRRPLIGTHPRFERYHIFNGLGAKGYMIGPLLSDEFVQYLTGNAPLEKEINIARCKNIDLI